MQIATRMSGIPKSGIREIFDLASSEKNIINLGIGEPDFQTPKFIRNAAKLAIDRGYNKYTVNTGIAELRAQISRKLKRENGIHADPDKEIIVTSGATQAIFVTMHCLLNPGDEVLLPSPLFVAYKQAARIAGGVPVEVPMNEESGYALDASALEKKITNRTRMIVLNSPCNPTGAVYEKSEIERTCELATKYDLSILSDEIYESFLYDEAKHFSPASRSDFRNRIITVNGFSKTFAMTGWRLGYAVAEEKIINAMTRFNMYNAVCPSSVAQLAGIAALKGSRSFFRPILKRYSELRSRMLNYLRELGFNYAVPKGAFYVFPDISSITRDSMSYSKELLHEKKVSTIPGSASGDAGEGHLRLSYSVSEEKLDLAMERISKFNKAF